MLYLCCHMSNVDKNILTRMLYDLFRDRSGLGPNVFQHPCMRLACFDGYFKRHCVTVKSVDVVIFFFCPIIHSPVHQASCGQQFLTWTERPGMNIWSSSRPKTWEGIWADYPGPQPSLWSWLMSTTTPLTSEGVSAAVIRSLYCWPLSIFSLQNVRVSVWVQIEMIKRLVMAFVTAV